MSFDLGFAGGRGGAFVTGFVTPFAATAAALGGIRLVSGVHTRRQLTAHLMWCPPQPQCILLLVSYSQAFSSIFLRHTRCFASYSFFAPPHSTQHSATPYPLLLLPLFCQEPTDTSLRSFEFLPEKSCTHVTSSVCVCVRGVCVCAVEEEDDGDGWTHVKVA